MNRTTFYKGKNKMRRLLQDTRVKHLDGIPKSWEEKRTAVFLNHTFLSGCVCGILCVLSVFPCEMSGYAR